MRLRRASLPVQHIPPVVISVIHPLPSSVPDDFHRPRAARILGLVVHTGKKLVHIFISVLNIILTTVGLPEFVDRIHRPVTPVFIVGRGSRLFPAETPAVPYGGLAVPVGSGLGSDKDHTECGTSSVDCGGRGILDNGDRSHIIRIKPVEVTGVTGHTVDNDQRIRRIDGIDASDINGA